MPGRYEGVIRALVSPRLAKLKRVPITIVIHDVSLQFQNATHALNLQFLTGIHNQSPRLSCIIGAGIAVSQWRPLTKNLDITWDPARIRAWDPNRRPAQILPLPTRDAWRVTVVDHCPAPSQTPVYRILSWPVESRFRTSIRAYPISYEMRSDRHKPEAKSPLAAAGRARVRIRASNTRPRAAIKEGLALSPLWRVRCPSLNLYRMPIAVWHDYVDEIRRQKGLGAKGIELLAVFPIPSRGRRDLSVDLEQDCLSYRLTGKPSANMTRVMLLVGRDRATGDLHTVIDRRPRSSEPTDRAVLPPIAT